MIHGVKVAWIKIKTGKKNAYVVQIIFFPSNSSERQWGEFERA